MFIVLNVAILEIKYKQFCLSYENPLKNVYVVALIYYFALKILEHVFQVYSALNPL